MGTLGVVITIYAACLVLLIAGQWMRQQVMKSKLQQVRQHPRNDVKMKPVSSETDLAPDEPSTSVSAAFFREHFRFLNKRKKAVLDHVKVEGNRVALFYRIKGTDFDFSDVLEFAWRVFEASAATKFLVLTLHCLKEASEEEKKLFLDIYGKVWAPFFSLRVPREAMAFRDTNLDKLRQLLPVRLAEEIGKDPIEPFKLKPCRDDRMLLEILNRFRSPQFQSLVDALLQKAGLNREGRQEHGRSQVDTAPGGTSMNYSDHLVKINQQLTKVILKQVQELEKMNRLKRYMSPQVVDNLLQEAIPGASNTGARKMLTVVFVDVRGFTEVSDKLDPEDLFILLNAYLTEMTRIVYGHGGTIDKFVGDGIMIFFGAPVPCEDHAARAIAMALEMQQQVPDLAASWHKFRHNFDIGIGINTGYAHVGNVGSEHHMNYTAIGHSVNLAARLEDLAEPGQILITERTLDEVPDLFAVEALGEKKVKGISEPVTIFNVLGEKPTPIHATSNSFSLPAAGAQHARDMKYADFRTLGPRSVLNS